MPLGGHFKVSLKDCPFKDHGAERMSKVAISLSSMNIVPPWSIDALVVDIRLWSKNMNLNFSWTSRDNNKVAHYVARLASSSTFSFSWDVTNALVKRSLGVQGHISAHPPSRDDETTLARFVDDGARFEATLVQPCDVEETVELVWPGGFHFEARTPSQPSSPHMLDLNLKL
ncbi:hypothetical protein Tco_0675047 [Tanacetum coccineum]